MNNLVGEINELDCQLVVGVNQTFQHYELRIQEYPRQKREKSLQNGASDVPKEESQRTEFTALENFVLFPSALSQDHIHMNYIYVYDVGHIYGSDSHLSYEIYQYNSILELIILLEIGLLHSCCFICN